MKQRLPRQGNEKGSLAKELTVILSLIFVILICILSFSMYILAERQIDSSAKKSYNLAGSTLGTAITVNQRGLEWYDAQYDSYLQSVLKVFSDSYDIAKTNGELPDLQEISRHIPKFQNGTTYLYLIDSEGVIIDTTLSTDLGIDFKDYPDFYEKLTEVRKGSSFRADPWHASLLDPKFNIKYGFLPSSDNKYVLETGLMSDSVLKERSSYFSFKSILSEQLEKNPDIISVFLYDRRKNLINHVITPGRKFESPALTEFELYEINEIVLEDKSEVFLDFPEKNILVHGFYIPYSGSYAVSSDYLDKVGIIIYDTRYQNQFHYILLFFGLIITLLSIIIAISFSWYISRRLIQPIERIISDIEQIANGDYDHRIQSTKGNETKRLQQAINQMVTVIQKSLADIHHQKMILDIELNKRLRIENELSTANIKLHHLSSITRHDILNQVTSLLGYLNIAKDEEPQMTHQYLDKSEQIAENIIKLVEFTRTYQNIGIRGPLWQDLSQVVNKVIGEVIAGNISFSINLKGYLIYTDPLFEKVLYNLIDNSIRHGGKNMDQISISATESDDTLIITYTDNGIGVQTNEKEKIFELGYGKNTGQGLFLIREILAITGIDITESGEYMKGSRFVIQVPKGAYEKD